MSEPPIWLSTWFPEWLQEILRAVAPVVALGLSTWAIWSPARARKREAMQRAQAIAVAIQPDIFLIQAALRKAEDILSQSLFSEAPNQRHAASDHASVARTLRKAAIPVPAMVDRLAEDMWRLGDERGVSAAQMVSLLYQWNQLVEKAATLIDAKETDDVSGLVTSMKGNFQALKTATEATDLAVEELHP